MCGLGGFFAGYVPGSDPVEFPEGTGKLLKAGSHLVFQMHYTPQGQGDHGLHGDRIPLRRPTAAAGIGDHRRLRHGIQHPARRPGP